MNIANAVWRSVVSEGSRRKIYHWRKRSRSSLNQQDESNEISNVPGESALRNQGLVSVVIPVYKVEEYLDECIHSVLSQSYKKIEVILVDDGSPDRCGEICDRYAEKYDSIEVVHQPNGGLSNARNNGLKAVTGEYVMFMDSDDVITSNAISDLLSPLVGSNADVSTGNVERMKGARKWQSWNQTYSHAKKETWDGKETAPASVPVTLNDAPELIFDATAWNKIFRTDFLRNLHLEFPEGKFYEDMLPMAEVFLAARRIVKVPSTVYLYREREDNSSITQERGQVKNLADKMEMVWHIERRLEANRAPQEILDTLYFKALEGDLAVYSPYLGINDEFDAIYLRELTKCWGKSSLEIKLALALDRRALYINQLFSSDYLSGEVEAAWFATNFHDIPLKMIDGVVHADVNYAPEHMAVLDEHGLLEMSRYVELKQVVTDAYIENSNIAIDGFAFLDHLPPEASQRLETRLMDAEGRSLPIEWHKRTDERANGYWRSGNSDRSKCGFEIRLPIAVLEDSGLDLGRDLTVQIAVQSGVYRRVDSATGYWRGGKIRLGKLSGLLNGHHYSLPWQPWGAPLRIRSVTSSIRAMSFDRLESAVRVQLDLGSHGSDLNVEAVRLWDGLRVPLEAERGEGGPEAWFSGDLENVARRRDSGGYLNAWRFEARRIGFDETIIVAASCEWSSGDVCVGTWSTRCSSESVALLHDGVTTLSVEDVRPLENGFVLVGSGSFEGHPGFSAEMWSNRGALQPVASVDLLDDSHFEITIMCQSSDGGGKSVAWEPGEYRFRLFNNDGRGSQYKIRAGREVVPEFPLTAILSRFRARWHLISDTWELALGVDAPQSDGERGRFNEIRMRNQWADKSDCLVAPMDAVVFSANMGTGSADSALEIFKAIRHRRPTWALYWAVTDYSVQVPDGAIALVRQTERWYEVLSRARLIVNNYGGIAGYGNRSYQRYLQTWHGTPLKHIGDSEFRNDSRSYARKKMIAEKEAQEWDWVLSPSRFVSEVIRNDLYFDGKILELGYPRNDALANSTDSSMQECRSRIGIDSNAKVLMYAPTFRDVSATGFSSPLVDYLELDKVAAELGDEWIILLRGHSFNARSDDRDRSSTRVLDVTKYPNVNDLMIACDVMVTDYSSIMFDFLVTGKPIVYFAPDVDEYAANRGMYFDYCDVLAGEIATTQEELVRQVSAISDTDSVQPSGDYLRQKERFAPLDDGGATVRVLNEISSDLEV